METSLRQICERTHEAEAVIIAGAGARGKELLAHLRREQDICIKAFFDNNEALTDTVIDHVRVMKPYKVNGEVCVYVIAVDDRAARKAITSQLLSLGIDKKEIVAYFHCREYEYMSQLDEKYYQDELQAMYYEKFGRKINWESPATYNEKINWEKLNVKDGRKTRLADKYLVREWIGEQIGDEYLTKLYGAWDDAADIDFDTLPDAFVLKVNNGSGRNIIVKNKAEINDTEIRRQLNEWKSLNFAYISYELHYKDIVPRIICEEYLKGVAETVYEYDVFCFHGKPAYIWCIKGSHRPDCRASFYDADWNMQPFSYGYPKDPVTAPKPEKLEEMLNLSRVLSREFEHVRIDWYNLPDGRVLFGEMSFSTWSGLMPWEPEEYDAFFGSLI